MVFRSKGWAPREAPATLHLFTPKQHFKITNLDDDVSLPGAAAVQLAVLLHHHNLPLLLHLVRVLLHVVEDAPVVLLGDADELVEDDMRTAGELVVEQNIAPDHIRVLEQQHRRSMSGAGERHGGVDRRREEQSNYKLNPPLAIVQKNVLVQLDT